MITILTAKDRQEQPWKNDGGITRPVMSVPGKKLEFGWRISLADVVASGPFSCFPDISRLMGILEGRLKLEVDGLPPQELGPGGPAFAFPGDTPAFGTPLGGMVRDINLMFDPSCFEASLDFIIAQGEERDSSSVHLLLALAPLSLNGHALGPLDAALIPAGVSFDARGGSFWQARLTPLP
jgi:environmental stress-induced protein Ves